MDKKNNLDEKGITKSLVALIFLEVVFFVFLIASVLLPSFDYVLAAAGVGNVSVVTLLEVGAVYPEITNITIFNNANTFDLSANSTKIIDVYMILRDYNGDADLNVTSVVFFSSPATYGGADDNNNHYTNSSCYIDRSYGDQYHASANCTLRVHYYASNSSWNATGQVVDNSSRSGYASDTININGLLALSLPDSLNYGIVNSTEVSDQKVVNVSNAGNVYLNLSLFGYGSVEGDGLAMNCTTGSLRNISIGYEQYNLTVSNSSQAITFDQFESQYKNLTSTPVVNTLNVPFRTNDTETMINDYNASYWRIYVPVGVAGNCSGVIVFGAVQAAGS